MASTADFKVIPEETELERLKRDLAFHPADPARATRLTKDQVESYNRQGFVRPFTAYSPDQILGVRAYFDRLLEKTIASGGNSYSISTAHLKYGGVYDILTNPVIVDHVSDLLGDNVVAWGSHSSAKCRGMDVRLHGTRTPVTGLFRLPMR